MYKLTCRAVCVVDKGAALAMAIRQIESSFGKGAVMQLGST